MLKCDFNKVTEHIFLEHLWVAVIVGTPRIPQKHPLVTNYLAAISLNPPDD